MAFTEQIPYRKKTKQRYGAERGRPGGDTGELHTDIPLMEADEEGGSIKKNLGTVIGQHHTQRKACNDHGKDKHHPAEQPQRGFPRFGAQGGKGAEE